MLAEAEAQLRLRAGGSRRLLLRDPRSKRRRGTAGCGGSDAHGRFRPARPSARTRSSTPRADCRTRRRASSSGSCSAGSPTGRGGWRGTCSWTTAPGRPGAVSDERCRWGSGARERRAQRAAGAHGGCAARRCAGSDGDGARSGCAGREHPRARADGGNGWRRGRRRLCSVQGPLCRALGGSTAAAGARPCAVGAAGESFGTRTEPFVTARLKQRGDGGSLRVVTAMPLETDLQPHPGHSTWA